MAEPTSPEEDPTVVRRPADSGPELLQPPTDEELAASGEPTADEIHAAAGVDVEPEAPAPTAVLPAAETAVIPAEETAVLPAAETAVIAPAAPVPPAPAAPVADQAPPPPPVPPQPQPVLAPADDLAPLPPLAKGNRLVGTLWVLLAAGLFQVVFFGINALVALAFGGSVDAASGQVQQIAKTSLAWLPVLLFFLLFELVVLLLNRAGRFAYVVASLVIGIVVYVGTVLLYSLIVLHTVGDANTLAQTFLNWEFILVGLVAREVMLWTGIAIGSRGIRVRNRNREARARYDQELADARA